MGELKRYVRLKLYPRFDNDLDEMALREKMSRQPTFDLDPEYVSAGAEFRCSKHTCKAILDAFYNVTVTTRECYPRTLVDIAVGFDRY